MSEEDVVQLNNLLSKDLFRNHSRALPSLPLTISLPISPSFPRKRSWNNELFPTLLEVCLEQLGVWWELGAWWELGVWWEWKVALHGALLVMDHRISFWWVTHFIELHRWQDKDSTLESVMLLDCQPVSESLERGEAIFGSSGSETTSGNESPSNALDRFERRRRVKLVPVITAVAEISRVFTTVPPGLIIWSFEFSQEWNRQFP